MGVGGEVPTAYLIQTCALITATQYCRGSHDAIIIPSPIIPDYRHTILSWLA
jgi:hypothetical protein